MSIYLKRGLVHRKIKGPNEKLKSFERFSGCHPKWVLDEIRHLVKTQWLCVHLSFLCVAEQFH